MTAAEKVIAIAAAELGYREKATNGSLDDKTANAGSGNWTKYARDLDAVTNFYNGAKNGYAWCDVFVDWCFYKAFGAETAKKLLCQPDRSAGAGCTYSLGYYKSWGRFYTSGPRAGDQIFFGSVGNSSHTGLVEAVDGNRVHTIEGNSSDGVVRRAYALNAANIAGYGRPNWALAETVQDDPYADEEPEHTDTVELVLPQLWKGMDNETVRAAQILLAGRGYRCGSMGADGDFGACTKEAVVRYQQAHGLEDDGVIGVDTWTSLLTRK